MTLQMQSPEIDKITAALIAASANFSTCTKDGKAHNYDYAKLPQILEAVLPSLREHGIMLKEIPWMLDGQFVYVVQVSHAESGQFIRGMYPIIADPNSRGQSLSQQTGSAITYACRYSIKSILSLPIADKEDDDGALHDAPQGEEEMGFNGPTSTKVQVGKATDKQVKMLAARTMGNAALRASILARFNIAKLEDMPFKSVNEALAMIDEAKQLSI